MVYIYFLLDIFNSLLSLSLLLALASKLPINILNSIPIGSLLESASESDSKSNEIKMYISAFVMFIVPYNIKWVDQIQCDFRNDMGGLQCLNLYIQYFKRIAHLAVIAILPCEPLCKHIYIYIQTLKL